VGHKKKKKKKKKSVQEMALFVVYLSHAVTVRSGGVGMMVAGTRGVAIPGRPSAQDESQFLADPRGFCVDCCGQSGPVFATGAFGDAVFVGGGEATDAVSEAGERVPGPLREPFGPLTSSAADGRSAFDSACGPFNDECYAALFQWVPLFKETGGFSTFRFDDFLDPRVRKALPAMRRVIFRATSPALLGCKLEDLPAAPGLESPKDWGTAYAEYAAEKMKPISGGFGLPFKLPVLGGGAPSLESALGAERAAEALAAVEPTAALLTSMLTMAQAHPEWDARLVAEQKQALTGIKPEVGIDSAILDAMPLLQAFALETLRMHPPARPDRLRLTRAVEVEGGVTLPAGTLVAPEPFVGHFFASVYDQPTAFNPDRFVGDAAAPAPALGLPGGAGSRGAAARELTLLVTKMAFVHMRRMHDVKLPLDRPAISGYPLWAIADSVELKATPYMYYELQRGVRKLKF